MKFRLLAVCAALLAVCCSASFGAMGWANYQWPCNGASYADNQDISVYTQGWKDGCTGNPGPCADLSVTIYYKRASEGSYTSAPMTFLGDVGSNDEYTFTIPASATVASDDEQYYFVWHDASDNSDFDPVDHCGGGTVPPLTLHITPATSTPVTVHFSVDMRCLDLSAYSAGVFFAGDFQGWNACVSAMTDGDNDGIYEGSMFFAPGSNPYHEYKHNRAGTDGCQWENSIGNRSFVIDESGPDQYLPTVKWDNWDCCLTGGPSVIDAPGSYCLQLCACDRPFSIQIVSPYNPPVLGGVTFAEGCLDGVTGCNVDCTPGSGSVGWGIRQGTDGLWYMDLCVSSGFPGCFCMTIDQILPVEFGSFAAVAGNGVVTLNWNTLSETDNDHFEITRNGSLVSRVNSLGNSANGHSYSWVDRNVLNGMNYTYTLIAVDVQGNREELASETATPGTVEGVIADYSLSANFPNPFNPTTSFTYTLKDAGFVNLQVFDLSGRAVATLVSSEQASGSYTMTFDANTLPSGIYYYRLSVNGFTATHKMVLMK